MAAASLLLNLVCILARSQTSSPCPPVKPIPPGTNITITMTNGEVAQGSVISSNSSSLTLNSSSFGQIVISVCNVRNIEEASRPSPPAAGSIASPSAKPLTQPSVQLRGLESLTVSMGFSGSASRDESYSAKPNFFAYEPKINGRTLLFLQASYDDKWKAAANSSNVTQVYSGFLQQMFTIGGSGGIYMRGNAYRNNSQGIIVDQEYGLGGAKTFAVPQGKNSYVETDFDIRAIH